MEVIITKHAKRQFRKRVENLPTPELTARVESLLAGTVDAPKNLARQNRSVDGKRIWYHRSTRLIFVVAATEQTIIVVSVFRFRKRARYREDRKPRGGYRVRRRHGNYDKFGYVRKRLETTDE